MSDVDVKVASFIRSPSCYIMLCHVKSCHYHCHFVIHETVSSRLNVIKYLFSQRILSVCGIHFHRNVFTVVTAPSVNSFKKRLDNYIKDMDNLKSSASYVQHSVLYFVQYEV